MGNNISNLNYEDSTSAGRKIVQIIQALEEVCIGLSLINTHSNKNPQKKKNNNNNNNNNTICTIVQFFFFLKVFMLVLESLSAIFNENRYPMTICNWLCHSVTLPGRYNPY